MTALVTPFSTSSTTPTSENSVPVLEFRCLYTSDLRRKQKRWQDGRLKYHTFNKRVMVYDESSNFVGDTHWRGENNFIDGEEVELERVGILVQVLECIGRRDQDLSELTDKRLKDRELRITTNSSNSASSRIPEHVVHCTRSIPADEPKFTTIHRNTFSRPRPKPLHDLLATPSGHQGRALIPTASPFEIRRREQQTDDCNERQLKRRKRELPQTKNGYAQNLTGATLSLSGRPGSFSPQIDPLLAHQSNHPEKIEAFELSELDDMETNLSKSETLTSSEKLLSKAKPKDLRTMRGAFATNLFDLILGGDPNPVANWVLPLSTERKLTPAPVACHESSNLIAKNQNRLIEIDGCDLRNGEAAAFCEFQRAEIAVLHTDLAPKVPKDHQSTSSATCDREVIYNNASRQGGFQAITPIQQNLGPLRIKSKPKKTMLFMSLPQTNSLRNTNEKNSLRKEAVSVPDEDVENLRLYVATSPVNVFGQAQKHQMPTELHTANLSAKNEGSLSYLEDAGADHRTIDELLSRENSLQSSKLLKMLCQPELNILPGMQQTVIKASFLQEHTALCSLPLSERRIQKNPAIAGINIDILQAVSPPNRKTDYPSIPLELSPPQKTAAAVAQRAKFVIEARHIAAEHILPKCSLAKWESEIPPNTCNPNTEQQSHLDFKTSKEKDLPATGKSAGNTRLPSLNLERKKLWSNHPEQTTENGPADSRNPQNLRLSYQATRDKQPAQEADRPVKGRNGFAEAASMSESPPLMRLTMITKMPRSVPEDGLSGISEAKAVLKAPEKLGGRGVNRRETQGKASLVGKISPQQGYGPWSAEAYDLMEWRPNGNTARC